MTIEQTNERTRRNHLTKQSKKTYTLFILVRGEPENTHTRGGVVCIVRKAGSIYIYIYIYWMMMMCVCAAGSACVSEDGTMPKIIYIKWRGCASVKTRRVQLFLECVLRAGGCMRVCVARRKQSPTTHTHTHGQTIVYRISGGGSRSSKRRWLAYE